MKKIELEAFEKLTRANYNRWLIPLADDLLLKARIKKGQILDVACGPGLLTKELAKRSKKFLVHGIDNSRYAVKLAQANCQGLQNAILTTDDVYNLHFPENKFDVVVCKDSLHHFDNPRLALLEMLRVLKPNGLLYLQDLKRDLPYYLLKRAIPPDDVIKKLQYYSARASYTKFEMENILKKLKIKNILIRTRKITDPIRKRYKKTLDINSLKESFQARYTAVLIK